MIKTLQQICGEAKTWTKAGMPVVSDAEQARRIGPGGCQDCQHFDPHFIGRCLLCGCFMAAKSWLATSTCPAVPPRWTATDRTAPYWFFGTPERQALLTAELEHWRGTPFWTGAAGQAVWGVKADCVSFCEAVMVAVGACQPIQWPSYVTHHGGESMRQVLVETLAKVPRLDRIWTPGQPMPEIRAGDLLAGSSGRALHHLAIAGAQNQVWHCLEQGGVQAGTLQDPIFQRHLIGVYRFRA